MYLTVLTAFLFRKVSELRALRRLFVYSKQSSVIKCGGKGHIKGMPAHATGNKMVCASPGFESKRAICGSLKVGMRPSVSKKFAVGSSEQRL